MAGSRNTFELTLEADGFCAVKLECSVPSGLCGIHPEAQLGSPDLDWLWQELEKRGLILVLDLGGIGSRSYQTEAVRTIAVRHPNLKIVVAHLGQPRPEAEAEPGLWNQWKEQVDLGLLANIWFDCASLIAFVNEEGYPFPSVERYLRLAVERIGAHKVMWGTDQPGTLLHATYRQYVELAKLHTGFLSTRDQALVLERQRFMYMVIEQSLLSGFFGVTNFEFWQLEELTREDGWQCLEEKLGNSLNIVSNLLGPEHLARRC